MGQKTIKLELMDEDTDLIKLIESSFKKPHNYKIVKLHCK